MKTLLRRFLIPFLILILGVALSGCGSGGGATLTVNTTDNNDDGVCNTAHCSLREAINKANTLTGTTTINFSIGGGGVQTIHADIPSLPVITSSVIIDGRSQPGYVSHPLIELRGYWDPDLTGDGLVLAGGHSSVFGLAINAYMNGIVLQNKGVNLIQGCYIGTDVTGMFHFENASSGVWIKGGGNNSIGGQTPEERNIISANNYYGIRISDFANYVKGNYIGVDATGGAALPNVNGGILVEDTSNTIGGSQAGQGNVISGNHGPGIVFTTQGMYNIVKGNYIGTDATGTLPLGNTEAGIELNGPYNNIGSPLDLDFNVISANGGDGILINPTSHHNEIRHNYIGTNKTGSGALGNHGAGIEVFGDINQIGGDALSLANVISGNDGDGVKINGQHNTVQGNVIGTNSAGSAALGNAGNGVSVYGNLNLVGGIEGGTRNTISGNEGHGVYITAHDIEIKGNYIGTDRKGLAPLGNGKNGVYVAGTGDAQIGDAASAGRNVISANGLSGISTGPNSKGVSVLGNRIGTDATGNAALGNIQAGITVWGANHLIGALQMGGGNLISGNLGPGILIIDGATLITIRNNYIGTNAAGTAALGNAVGIEMAPGTGTTHVMIGGAPSGGWNMISGNDGEGLILSSGATVLGNFIGTDYNNLALLGNGADGIRIKGPGNEIGRTGFPNTIAHNGGHGVAVISEDGGATGNPILTNAVFDNGGLGIAINGDVVIPNDYLDPDDGDNNSQNYPLLQSAVIDPAASVMTVSGILSSTPASSFTVDIFTNDFCDPSGYGEGQRRVKQITVVTDINGNASLTAVLPAFSPGAAGFVTATATDEFGNTSGFSGCIPYTDAEEGAAPEPEGMSFSPFIDPAEIFFGRGCTPNRVRIGVEIAGPPDPVSYVLLFVRLFDLKTEAKSGWSEGLNMQASGENTYFYDLLAEDVPEYPDFPDAVLQYQFVAYNKAQEVIGRSEIYGDILFKRCG
ncbi:MAG: CSLREA domain-containing protein [Anaerolineales bacterium]